jgi:hypothetical protein
VDVTGVGVLLTPAHLVHAERVLRPPSLLDPRGDEHGGRLSFPPLNTHQEAESMKMLAILLTLPVVTVIVLIETAKVARDGLDAIAGPYIDMGPDL